jgi:DNA-directed RNA polymerase specialized sigma24 family protein
MKRRPIGLSPFDGSVDALLTRVAARDRAAFAAFFRRLVNPTFLQVRLSLGNTAAAVSVTRAVFVEVWLLAPHTDRHDALGWVSSIASRRAADRLRAINHHHLSPIGLDYETHTDAELVALLRPDPHAVFARIEAARYECDGRPPVDPRCVQSMARGTVAGSH